MVGAMRFSYTIDSVAAKTLHHPHWWSSSPGRFKRRGFPNVGYLVSNTRHEHSELQSSSSSLGGTINLKPGFRVRDVYLL